MQRRRRRRRYRWRPPNWLTALFSPIRRRRRRRQPAHLRWIQLGLAAAAAVALVMAGSVVLRSIRTARLNESLVVMHTLTGDEMEAEIAAPPIETARAVSAAPAIGELASMGLPDGTAIRVPDAVTVTRFHRTDLDILPDMLELSRANPDTVGWIGIAGVVHLPVVYRDNTYYLDHDFSGAKNASGTLFLDQSHPLTEVAQNLLIHGHSMNDGSMFGILTHYRKLDFLRQHPLISFSTLWEKETYAIFAVLKVSSRVGDADYFNYFTHPDFASDAAFDAYIDEVEKRSMFDVPVSVAPSDALLTLSTCIDDDRLVVVARRLRASETKDELVSAVEESTQGT